MRLTDNRSRLSTFCLFVLFVLPEDCERRVRGIKKWLGVERERGEGQKWRELNGLRNDKQGRATQLPTIVGLLDVVMTTKAVAFHAREEASAAAHDCGSTESLCIFVY